MNESEKVISKKAEGILSLLDSEDRELINIYISLKRNEAVALSKMLRNLYIAITVVNGYYLFVNINHQKLEEAVIADIRNKECLELGYSIVDENSCNNICYNRLERNKENWKSAYIEKNIISDLDNYSTNGLITKSFWSGYYSRYDLSMQPDNFQILNYFIDSNDYCFNYKDSPDLCFKSNLKNDNNNGIESLEFQQKFPCAYRALRIIDECGG